MSKLYKVVHPEGISLCCETEETGETVVAFLPAETYEDLPYGAAYQTPDVNSERIVACVNACEGINPEAVKGMLFTLNCALDTLILISTHSTQHFIDEFNIKGRMQQLGATIAKAESEANQ